jgi:hypothetical protein
MVSRVCPSGGGAGRFTTLQLNLLIIIVIVRSQQNPNLLYYCNPLLLPTVDNLRIGFAYKADLHLDFR